MIWDDAGTEISLDTIADQIERTETRQHGEEPGV